MNRKLSECKTLTPIKLYICAMESVNNNQFEVIPNSKIKRKIVPPSTTAYFNPALDILANDDPMCNNAMEIIPVKKRKRTKSCDIAVFENNALDLGISKAAVNEFLVKELENVRKTIRAESLPTLTTSFQKEVVVEDKTVVDEPNLDVTECATQPIYVNLKDPTLFAPEYDNPNETTANSINIEEITDKESFTKAQVHKSDEVEIETHSTISGLGQRSLSSANVVGLFEAGDLSTINHTNITNNIFVNHQTNLSLSFIDRLALDSPNLSNRSLYLDDDLNESNIMEIKTITIITKKKHIVPEKKKSTNPFLNQSLDDVDNAIMDGENPFLNLDINTDATEMEYNVEQTCQTQVNHENGVMHPRRLFVSDTNSTISTMNESLSNVSHEYENVDEYRSESPIYENIGDLTVTDTFNKQSKILGLDVTKFSAVDIMNLNKNTKANSSSDSNDSRKHLKHTLLKAGNKLSKKVFKTLKKTFKSEKPELNVTSNPYEVPRKLPKRIEEKKESGIENPALNLDNSDDIEIEELDDEEHQYETIKTLRNTRLNMNVTPLKERTNDPDISQNKTYTPGKKVRFDSTLNKEKIITGNSFDYGIQSPGFDAKIDKYQDELENCINERKIIQQNM